MGLGEGAIDHATPLRLLNEAGFDGYFSVEVIHKSGSAHDADGVLGQYAEGFRGIVGSVLRGVIRKLTRGSPEVGEAAFAEVTLVDQSRL